MDSGKDGDSMENQIHLVTQYIQERSYLTLTAIFADNGETGTNFNRPQWCKLITAIESGAINCVIVKDLSRLGRNYIETGDYLERIFPSMGIRFIAVTDSYDSEVYRSENLSIALKGLVNDIYAKDISRKTSAAFEVKQRKGEFIGSYAAYGYAGVIIETKKSRDKMESV